MVRDSLTTSHTDDTNGHASHTPLHQYLATPQRIAGGIALLAIPSVIFGWWYYSFASSVATIAPQRSADLITQNLVTIPGVGTPTETSQSEIVSGIDATRSNDDNTTMNVEINGQTVPLGSDGSVHQVVETDDGNMNVDISVQSDTSGSTSSSSSTNIRMHTSSSNSVTSKVDINTE